MTQNYIEKCQVEISKSKSLETDKLMVYAYNDTFFNSSETRDWPPYSILILVEIIINIFECKSIRSKLNWRGCHMTVSHDSGGVSSSYNTKNFMFCLQKFDSTIIWLVRDRPSLSTKS